MKKYVFAVLVFMASKNVMAQPSPLPVVIQPSVMVSSISTNSGAAITVTLTTPTTPSPYSIGNYDYLTNIHIEAAYVGGVAGSSTPLKCTTTNVAGNPAFFFAPAISTGTMQVMDIQYSNPTASINVSSNTVVSCPASANVQWNVIVGHFTAP